MHVRVNIRRVKQLVWLLCAATFAFAGWTFFDIYTSKERGDYTARKGALFEDLLRSHVNDQGRARKVNIFYPQERYVKLWEARVDGSRKPVEPPPGAVAEAAPERVVPDLATLIDISLILYSENPVERMVAITYKPDAKTDPEGKVSRLHLAEGDPLAPPYDADIYNGMVKSIGLQEVTFRWGKGEATLTPKLGNQGTEKPINQFDVAEKADPTADIKEAPDDSVEVQPRVWVLGKKDRERMQADPQRFIEEDINVRTITAAGGGRTQIEITEVKGGSLAEKLGAQAGDKIISINEIPMSSLASAINWFKANPNLPEYRVVYERAGQVQTWSINVK